MINNKGHAMYELYWTNHNYLADQVFETLDEAIQYGRSKGFEFSVFLDGDIVGFASGPSLGWNPQTMLSVHQATDKLMHMKHDELHQLVHDSYKDQYNCRPKRLSEYSVPELVSWYISHYKWNESDQMWESVVPFYSSIESEVDYYNQFY